MGRGILGTLACLAVLLALGQPGAGASEAVLRLPARVAAAPANAAYEAQALQLVNRSRAAAGLSPLTLSIPLRTLARRHGAELFAGGILSHTSSDGRNPHDRILAAGIPIRLVGENLAFASSVQEAHAGLMASPGHRRNILSPRYHHLGIGVLDGGRRGVIVVQDFSN